MLFNYLNRNSTAIKVEKVLAMLVESGFIYCCIWVRGHLFASPPPKLIRWGLCTGALSDIHIPGITRSLVRRNERLPCIFLGSLKTLFSRPIFFLLIRWWTGPLPDGHLYFCHFKKISDAHDNQAACERALF